MHTADIKTADGICPSFIYHPEGDGPWPGVLMFMDGPGMRPAIQAVAQRLADAGYYVLLPDLFYRSGPYAPIDAAKVFSDKASREQHRETFMAKATPKAVMSDLPALLDFLAAAPQVAPAPVGVVGYCMGGRLALIAAGTYPEHFIAAASYHGGGLANDTPSSPHLLASKMRPSSTSPARPTTPTSLTT